MSPNSLYNLAWNISPKVTVPIWILLYLNNKKFRNNTCHVLETGQIFISYQTIFISNDVSS